MTISFVPVKTAQDQEVLARMAGEIWREYWTERIGKGQTEYMIDKFQSLHAIRRDMAENGYEYWFLVATQEDEDGLEKSIVGYTGGHVEDDAGAGADTDADNEEEGERAQRFFISKVYLFADARGRGYARRTMEFYEDLCFARGLTSMYLTVNKQNDLAIRAYEATGFQTVDAVVTDIGSGFVMDDYIMEVRF